METTWLRLLPGKPRKWTKLYMKWSAMRWRCLNPRHEKFAYYGGRGIRICAEWSDYATFRAWAIANGFRKGLSLDRIDPNGDYCPANCRWVPLSHQQDNTRTAHLLTVNGETKSLAEWARIIGCSANLLRSRLYEGWKHEEILTVPRGSVRPGHRRGRRPRVSV